MKKIMKRNISVFLAVCMLLSCWVFVAPQKAKAVVEQETYDITVLVNIVNENDRDDNYYTIKYMRPNGSTGSIKKERAAQKGAGVDGNADYRADTYQLEGIPISLHYCCNGYETSTWYIEGVALDSGAGATIFEGQLGARTAIYSRKTQGDIDFQNQTISLEDHGYDRKYEWTHKENCTPTSRPHVAAVSIETIPEETQIPNEPGEVGTANCAFVVRDQYGVRLGSKYYNIDITPTSNNGSQPQSSNIAAVEDDSIASSVKEGYQIQVSEGARRLDTVYNSSTGRWSGGGSDSFDEPMKLTVTDKKDATKKSENALILPLLQPTYDVYFSECAGGDGVIEEESIEDLTYSMPIGALPGADRVGHTFLGFYETGGVTKDANNIPSSFGAQITEGTIVTGNNENTPYRAGWAAAPCTVTVRNNKRQTIGFYTGQYGYTLGNSINTGYNASQLNANAAYVKSSGESGEYNNLQPYKYVISEGYEYVGSNDQVRSEDQVGQVFTEVTLVGDIIVDTRYKQTGASQYTVNFYDNNNTALEPGTASRSNYAYGAFATAPTGERNSYSEDNTYTYAFVGWAKQRHAGENHYFLDVRDDGELSQAIPLVNIAATPIMADVNYVAVYSRTYKDYSATFHYWKDGDEEIVYTQEDAYHYNSHINAPTTVTREIAEDVTVTENATASYIARGYTWDFDGWYTAQTGGTKVLFNDMSDVNALMNNTAGKEFWAHYTQGEPTTNRIRFFTKAGALLESQEVEYSETDNATVPEMAESAENKLRARGLYNYSTDTMRYAFDKWVNVQNGEELPYSERPLSPADYYPSYIEDPLYKLRLFNGARELYSYTDTENAQLDVSALSTSITSPSRAGDEYSSIYVFKGWSEEAGFLWTEGETLVDLNSFVFPAEDVTLYAHFSAVPIDYTVRFLRDDMTTVISSQTLHYGDPINVPELTDEEKTKDADYYYEYTFMGWNLEPEDTCTGDMDYFMTFRKGYRYYKVYWLDYNGNQTGAPQTYVYNAHIQKPYNTPVPPEYLDANNQPDTSKAYVFDYWEYVNADGEPDAGIGRFAIGQKLGGAIQAEIDNGTYTGPLTPAYWVNNNNTVYLRAHCVLSDNFVTITKYDGIEEEGKPFGEPFGTERVIYGSTLGELDLQPSAFTKQYTSEHHYKFARWKKITGETTSIGMENDYPFTDKNTAIVESFAEEAHGAGNSHWDESVSANPTFTEQGQKIRTCSECGYQMPSDVIPVLQDTTAPTGRLFVKDYQWTEYPAELDSEDPERVALNSIIIVNAEDMANNAGDVAANGDFNRNGDGSGVATIEFSLVRADEAPANPASITTWYTGYTYSENTAANASLTVQNLIATDNGGSGRVFPQIGSDETFVIYVRLTDNAAQINAPAESTVPNVTYLRSDVLILDTTSPTIEITSTDGMVNSIRHCEDATITIADTDLATVTLNGSTTYQLPNETVTVVDAVGATEITIGEDEAAQTYALNDRGALPYMVDATTHEPIDIPAEGDDVRYVYAYNDGENELLYYGEAANETTYTPEVPEPEPGEEPVEAVTYDLVPLFVYRYNTAAEGEDPVYAAYYGPAGLPEAEIEDTTYALEAMHVYTYSAPGEVKDLTELVGDGLKITRRGQYQVVAIDNAGNSSKANFEIIGTHNLVTYIVEPTCTSDGTNAKRCTVCGQMPEEYFETVSALGHHIVHKVEAATCVKNGREYDYCDRCGMVEEETIQTIAASGHTWQNREDAYVLRAATCSVAGVLRFNCTKCSATRNEPYAALDPSGENYRAALAADPNASAALYGHNLYPSETLPATCTSSGDVSRQCKYCSVYFVMQVLPALGHTPSTKNYYTVQAATCTGTGLRAPYCANGCGTVMYDETVETPMTLNDVDGLTETTFDDTVYPLTNEGKARAKADAEPDLQTYVGESADETVYEGRALTPLYVYRYNSAPEGDSPTYVTVYLPENTEFYGTYRLEAYHSYSYKMGDEDILLDGLAGQTEITIDGTAHPLTDLGQVRATDYEIVDGEYVTTYIYQYDLNDAEQYLYTYEDGGETKFFQSNSADETEYEGHELTALYVYRYNTAAAEEEPAYETVNAPINTETYGDYALTPLYTYSFTVTDSGEFGSTYLQTVPALGHDFKFVEKVEPTATTEGYDLYECTRCDAEEHRNVVPPIKYCAVTLYDISLNAAGETVPSLYYEADPHVPAGTKLTQGDIGTNPTLAANDTFKYVFRGWSKTKQDLKAMQDAAIAADKNMPQPISDGEEMPETDPATATLPELVNLPLTIEDDTTLYAVYQPRFVNYMIKLYKEDGTTLIRKVGYLHYGNVVSPSAPVSSDASAEFVGWQILNPQPGDETGVCASITINKDASYKAVYSTSGAPTSFKVFWMYGTTKLGEATVAPGEDATYVLADPDPIALGLKPSTEEHYYFTGWSRSTTNVTENLRVYAQFAKAAHTFTRVNTTQTCTTGDGYKQECTFCHYFEEFYNTQPLGHKWIPNGSAVLPVVHQDGTYDVGYQSVRCERCGITDTQELQPVKLDVTVKDTAGTPLEGAKVTVYRDETPGSKIMHAFSGSDGVAHLLVPVAGSYRIVVEYDGKQASSNVTVDGNGKITGGSMPTIMAPGQAAGCPKNCTCHQSGLWPMIYRAIHTVIYWFTRTRCCPDADYI